MRRPRRLPRLFALVALASCGHDGPEPTDPTTPAAALRLSAVTSGPNADLDGYTYALDGNPAARLGPNASVTLAGLAPGAHQLTVGGVAANCALAGGATRPVTLTAGDTTEVALTITCQAPPPGAHPAGTVAAVVPLQGGPYGVAVSPAGVVYAALIGGTSLARGDLATMRFTDNVVVGNTPPHVAFNPAGTKAYATLQTGQGLAVVDVATNALTTTLPLASDGFNLAVAPDGERVYATTAGGTLYVVDAAADTVITTLSVGGTAANGLAFAPGGAVLYVSSRDGGRVVAVDPVTDSVTRTYVLGGAPQRLAVAPDGGELYVANEATGLDIVNVASGAITSIGFGTAGYGLGLTPDGAHLYVLLPDAGEVRVLDRATRAPLKTIVVGGRPRNVAFTRDGRTALVATEEAVVFIK
jgi:YVTN family beta-propeller protein